MFGVSFKNSSKVPYINNPYDYEKYFMMTAKIQNN